MTLRGLYRNIIVLKILLIYRVQSSELELKLVFLNIRYHHKPVHSHTQEER